MTEKARRRLKPRTDAGLEYAANFPYLADVQFLADARGQPRSVLVPIEGFRHLMRDYWALATVVASRKEDFIDFEEFVSELRADGLLPPES